MMSHDIIIFFIAEIKVDCKNILRILHKVRKTLVNLLVEYDNYLRRLPILYHQFWCVLVSADFLSLIYVLLKKYGSKTFFDFCF